VASVFAAPLLIASGGGLIVNISSTGAVRYAENVAYGVGKAGVDKLAADMAEELRPYNVACVSLWPRLTKTEDLLAQPNVYPDLTRPAPPRLTGGAVTALAADPDVMEKTGTVLNVLDLAREYGFTDLDGSLPDWDY
jgi:dehydrogenase/reductase SDR family protein 1